MGPGIADSPNVILVNSAPNGFSSQAPLIIGIAGGSGSGKTTIAAAVVSALPGVVLIQHDSYYRHRPELSFEERSRVNYDHPDSLETELLIAHLRLLSKGAAIDRPTYDFTDHLISEWLLHPDHIPACCQVGAQLCGAVARNAGLVIGKHESYTVNKA